MNPQELPTVSREGTGCPPSELRLPLDDLPPESRGRTITVDVRCFG